MKILPFGLVAILIATFAFQVHAADITPLRVGDPLPRIEGSFLTGRGAALPNAAAGTSALLLVGFTYQSRFPVEAWADWFRDASGAPSAVSLFEVPMIGGMAKLGRWFIDRGMRKGTPVALHENVITVYEGSGDWKRRLGVTETNEDDAFLILVDRHGIVRWLHHGSFNEAVAGTLESALASVSAPSGS